MAIKGTFFFQFSEKIAQMLEWLKAAKYEIEKSSTCRAALFRCKFSSMFPVFHLT